MVIKVNNFQKVSFCLPIYQKIWTEILHDCTTDNVFDKMVNKKDFLKILKPQKTIHYEIKSPLRNSHGEQ